MARAKVVVPAALVLAGAAAEAPAGARPAQVGRQRAEDQAGRLVAKVELAMTGVRAGPVLGKVRLVQAAVAHSFPTSEPIRTKRSPTPTDWTKLRG